MTPNDARTRARKIRQLRAQMVAYATGGRTQYLPDEYQSLFTEVTLALENGRYVNPSPHKSQQRWRAPALNAHSGRGGILFELAAPSITYTVARIKQAP